MINELMELIEKEGNRKEFRYKGYKCLIKRDPFFFHLMGYVGMEDNDIFYQCASINYYINCHGGITYCGALKMYLDQGTIINTYMTMTENQLNNTKEFFIDESGNLDYIGFDCSHLSVDLIPYIYLLLINKCQNKLYISECTYKDMLFCENECKSIVDQLIDLNDRVEAGQLDL